jgi:LmbE family N-acetylglucosaminyl deacetylase
MACLVFCHAHPDDEALLTAGTMAKAVAAGHRVVLIMATDGAQGLVHSDVTDVVHTRDGELAASAAALGVHRVIRLGYPDSGLDGSDGFRNVPVADVAQHIAAIAIEERADSLIGYDPAGGYGHPDHVHVHEAVRAAARQLPNVRLFEATLPREPIARAVHLAARLRLTPPEFDPTEFDHAWTPKQQITHRVNVRGHLAQKRAAQAAHASQAGADSGLRTLQVLSRLPAPLARYLLGTEFYVEVQDAHTVSTNDASS